MTTESKTTLFRWVVLLYTQPTGTMFKKEILDNIKNIIQSKNNKITKKPPNNLYQLLYPKNLSNKTSKTIENTLKWAEHQHNHIITFGDKNYPKLLKEIKNPPPILFVKGSTDILKNQQIAIVGSRNPSYGGNENAYEFSTNLSKFGLTITSGLAIGIDTVSHLGAIKNKGTTIAVMGSGIDNIYPKQNKKLAEKILSNKGALVSEFPLGTKPIPLHFPLRNRIISGLSLGTLVVEATIRSGSLITARLAGEQNREVFAIPGSINNPLSKGCHQLIKQGAKLVETVQDILEELPIKKTIDTTKTNNLNKYYD